MASLRFFLLALTLKAGANAASPPAGGYTALTLEPVLVGGFNLVMQRDEEKQVIGHIGRTLLTSNNIVDSFEGGITALVDGVNLTVNTLVDEEHEAQGVRISWNAGTGVRLEDCIDFADKHWYGGPMQMTQIYPIENATLTYSPFTIREEDNGAILERYWLNSAGEYYYVHPEVPLFVDYNNLLSRHICFGAQIAEPYSSLRNHTELSYDVWFLPDAKKAHLHAVSNYLGKPSGVVDYRMVKYPIWSSWAQFGRDIDHDKLIDFAQGIVNRSFENAQFEIDDKWETCYGSLTVDEGKFENFTATVSALKSLGFRVSLWAHPFINKDCEPWYSTALNKSYLVLNEAGSPDTQWWNSNSSGAAYIDFTNAAAADWWTDRVRRLATEYGVDSFKFDAGESSHSPQVSVQTGDPDLHPHHIVQEFVKTCAKFGDMVEVKVGFQTQNLPVFVRMVDRDSIWGLNNGLASVITTTFQMNFAGYTQVLPDMIGGNGFNLGHEQADLPTKELFIRWVQANTFLPAMQFSYVPWNFDEETVNITRKYVELHAAYAEEIYACIGASSASGAPVVVPLWWLQPDDEDAQLVWDEYLLGENILVAPVLIENATSRDIYLPIGTWLAEGDANRVYEGPQWVRNYSAPLDTLPYFVRKGVADLAVAPLVSVFLVLFSLVLVNLV